MRIQIIMALTLVVVLARPAVCESVHGADSAGGLWFGASPADLEEKGRFDGRALRIKARFMRELADEARVKERGDGKYLPRTITFLVAAAGGEIRCEVSARSKCSSVVRGMKPATPLVIHGTLDAGKNVFLVEAIVQGWGRNQMKGNP
jgi:hypothetical protein